MPAQYIDTPRTHNATTFSMDGLDNISPEKSFAAPADAGDVISQMKRARSNGMNLKTPRVRTRDPLKLLPNGNQAPTVKPEFTPLMRSVTKTNMARRLSTRSGRGIETPGQLRNSYIGGATPGLPRMEEETNLGSELTGSSAGRNDYTPVPQNIDSSAQGTPLAQLPGRDAVLNDGNMMTLREQENIIDKIEKENFGLKMKIHFLEQAISKRGGEFNQAALKENTDLKVNRISMQRELHKFKKTLAMAERDAEIYRQQLEDYRERVRRKQIDESIRIEVEHVRAELKSKDAELEELRSKYQSAKEERDTRATKLQDEIEDLQAELREKDRQVDEKEDVIDSLKLNSKKESNSAAELEDELDSAKQLIEELKSDLERAQSEVQEAKEEKEEAFDEKRRAEDNLDELRDEMANKSFTTKGLSRQLEEKVDRLEEENQDLEQKVASLRAEVAQKTQVERTLQDRLRDTEKDGSSDARRLQQELEEAQQQRDTFERKYNNAQRMVESTQRDLQVKTDEKDLLQTRHDSLTAESGDLQKDLAKARKTVQELNATLEQERLRSMQNDNSLRTSHRTEVDILNEQIDTLHRDINIKESEHAADMEESESRIKELDAASKRAEEKAAGLQRTVDKLQDAQGTLSGREMKLQEAVDSEKQRHAEELRGLNRQIEDLNQDLAAKRNAADQNRLELSNSKEELRISIREQAGLKEKVSELEDEIEVLQADIEQEHEYVQQLQQKSTQAADGQLAKLMKDKRDLQESLANVQVQLQSAKRENEALETERLELEAKAEKARQAHDDTFDGQQEKRDLRRGKQKLEKDLEILRSERDALSTANEALENEINAEIERANAEEIRLQSEIDQLKTRQLSGTDSRDRELTAAKQKVNRLEDRVRELEEMLNDHSRHLAFPDADVSGLRDDLVELRKNEAAAAKRETELKSANRDLKIKVNDLERDLHEARLAHLKSRSPSSTPPPSHSKELTQARQELVDARAQLKVLQNDNRELKRSARRLTTLDSERVELEAEIKAGSVEVEGLAAQLAERNDELQEIRAELERVRRERSAARSQPVHSTSYTAQINDLKLQVKQLRSEKTELLDGSGQLPARDTEAVQLKVQLQRLREERSEANQRAETIEHELDDLQLRYESVLEKLTSMPSKPSFVNHPQRLENSSVHDPCLVHAKEIKGLIKEITYLKAKLRREERLRHDLAWSKTYLEQHEAMRAQCNQIDLRILRDMGVNVAGRQKYEKPLSARQKFRAGVFTVVAAMRMSNMEEMWRENKKIGEDLKARKRLLMEQQQNKQRQAREKPYASR